MRKRKKTVLPKPVARFRVYGWKSSLYFLVTVWPTQKAMLDHRVSAGLPRLRDCQAHVWAHDSWRCVNGKRDHKLPCLGEIHFHRRRLGTEVISHEGLHATVGLMQRLRFDFSRLNDKAIDSRTGAGKDGGEEIVALVHGKLCRAIVDRLYRLEVLH